MRTPDWEFTEGDERAKASIELKGTDSDGNETAQVLAEGDTVAFNYQRSGGRGERVTIAATVVSRGEPASSPDVDAVPAVVEADLPADLEPGRYESSFIVTFADGSKKMHWPNGQVKLFGRVHPGFLPAPETSP